MPEDKTLTPLAPEGNCSNTIANLAASLAKAQGEIENAKKSETNPHFKNKYADLASVWDACRAPLSKNGLAVVQTMRVIEGEKVLETLLLHASGEWMRGTLPLIVPQMNMQGLGSALTYARRYSLAALCGIAQEDDDGNATGNGGGKRPESAPAQNPEGPRPRIEQPRPGSIKPNPGAHGPQLKLQPQPEPAKIADPRLAAWGKMKKTQAAKGYSDQLCRDIIQTMFNEEAKGLTPVQIEELARFVESHTTAEAADFVAGKGADEFFETFERERSNGKS